MQDEKSRNQSREDQQSRKLIGDLPDNYLKASEIVSQVHAAFHRQLAAALQPKLNEYLKTCPQDTLAQKQALATWTNGELRRLGLTIRCPITGNPAILIADFKNAQHEHVSRFRVQARDEQGKRTRSCLATSVPDLELMADPPRRESLSRGFNARDPEGRA